MKLLRSCAALLLAAALALTFAACGGKGNTAQSNDALKARLTDLYESDTLAEMIADPEQYADEIAAYGMEDFAATFADTDAFRTYTVEISVQNLNDFDIQILNMQMNMEKQGKNGVWFSVLNEAGTMGLPAEYNGDEALYYYAIADASLSKQDVLQRLGEMEIACVYMKGSEAPDIDAQIDPALLYTSGVLCAE